MKADLCVACLCCPPARARDGAEFGRILAARAFAAATQGAELVVFPGLYGMHLAGELPPPGPELAQALQRRGSVRRAYLQGAARAARVAGVYLVPGSILLPVDEERYVHYVAVLSPSGELLGEAVQVCRGPGDEALLAGQRLGVVPTPVATLGLLLGADVECPELAVALSLQGAEILVAPLAPQAPYPAERAMAGLWRQVQQVPAYGLQAGLMGSVLGQTVAGKAGVVSPARVSPDGSGFLPRAGYLAAEGAVTARLSAYALRQAELLMRPWWPGRGALAGVGAGGKA